MASSTASLSSQYYMRLTVNVRSQNQSAKTTTYDYSIKIIKRSGSGYWSYESSPWTLRSPYGSVIRSGSLGSFDFRNYTTLTVRSGQATFSGTGTREWAAVFDGRASGIGNGTARLSLKPPAFKNTNPPSAPTLLTITRESDKRHKLNWNRNNGNGNYTSVTVQRSTNGSSWSQVGKPGGNAFTFTDTSTVANQRYYYRVRAHNSNGTSGWSGVSGPVYTTPAAPSGISAKREGTGIAVNASGKPPYATSYDIEDDGTAVATSVSLPWTHASPPNSVQHRYRIRSKRGSLVSGWSAYSAYVQLPAPPAAPSKLTPNGAVLPADEPVTLSWQHNPIDSSDQVLAEVRWRAVGDAWTTESTPDLSFEVTPGSGDFEWQVRTRGGHAEFGAWSPTATFHAINKPTVSITQPDSVWDTPRLTVVWGFSQSDDRLQGQWIVTLFDIEGEQLERKTGTGVVTETQLSTRLVDGAEYSVTVEAATAGVWSEPTQAIFSVEFVPPEEPQAQFGWDDDHGAASITVMAGEGDAPETISMTLERSIDGEDWELVAENMDPEGTVADYEALSHGETLYRVTAFAATGASAEYVESLVTESWAVWLSGGVGFVQTARLPYDPEVGVEAGRERTAHRFEGRSLPVAYASAAVNRAVNFAGTVLDGDESNTTRDDLREIAQAAAPVSLYRDPTGARLYGILSNVSMDREFDGVWKVGFTVEETSK